jgi:hypothetical protein
VQYTTAYASETAAAAYAAELARYRSAEAALRLARAYALVRPEQQPLAAAVGASQRFVPADVRITDLYDEKGVRHKWKEFIFEDKSNEEGKLEKIEGNDKVSAARVSGALDQASQLVDVACTVCGVRQSATGTLDAARAAASLRANSEIEAFYMFYETRCPKGSAVHEWRDGRCVACGRAPADTSGDARRAYYDKYAAAFDQARRASQPLASQPLASQPRASQPLANQPLASQPLASQPLASQPFTPDFSALVEAAALADTSPAVLQAIGASAGREFADIAVGRKAPPPPTSVSDPRIYAADAAARALLADFGSWCRSGALEPEVAASAVSADIGANYGARFAALLRANPGDAHAFAIQSLCEFALKIAKMGPAGDEFARRALAAVVRGVRRLSKPGPFDWALFGGDRDRVDELAQAPDQVGDVGEDVGLARSEDPYETVEGSSRNIDFEVEGNPNEEPP